MISNVVETLTNASSRDVVRIERPSVLADAVSLVAVRLAVSVISASYLVARCYKKKSRCIFLFLLLRSNLLPLHGIWGGVPTKPDSHSQ